MGMIKTAKAFIIVGMIFTSLLSYFVMCPTAIIFGVKALKLLKNPTIRDRRIKYGILTIIFVNQIAGILLLASKDDNLIEYQNAKGYSNDYIEKKFINEEETINDFVDDPIIELQKLKNAYDKGLIDEDTYNEKKKKYIDKV